MNYIEISMTNLFGSKPIVIYGSQILSAVVLFFFAWILFIIARYILIKSVKHYVKQTKTVWDDIMMQRHVFKRIAVIVPALFVYLVAPFFFSDHNTWWHVIQYLSKFYMIISLFLVADSLLNSFDDIYKTYEISTKIPIKGFLQIIKIFLSFSAIIIILSMILNKSPLYFIGGLGAMTAVLLLIFKDSILGFVAGIQLTANRMLQIGDWVECSKFGADGDVIDITLTTIKVQNFDKTITTIPAYSFIADSFKNWRGMVESDGRRIKRNINIDISTVKFCSEEMLKKFKKIQYISEYVDSKNNEIAEYNLKNNIDDSVPVNGRRLTNIGMLRAYIQSYLRNNPHINQDMTLMVRQLQPTEMGLPIEIYVFSKNKNWVDYEDIQSDIFDHLLAIVPEFDLSVFQNPSGSDLKSISKKLVMNEN